MNVGWIAGVFNIMRVNFGSFVEFVTAAECGETPYHQQANITIAGQVYTIEQVLDRASSDRASRLRTLFAQRSLTVESPPVLPVTAAATSAIEDESLDGLVSLFYEALAQSPFDKLPDDASDETFFGTLFECIHEKCVVPERIQQQAQERLSRALAVRVMDGARRKDDSPASICEAANDWCQWAFLEQSFNTYSHHNMLLKAEFDGYINNHFSLSSLPAQDVRSVCSDLLYRGLGITGLSAQYVEDQLEDAYENYQKNLVTYTVISAELKRLSPPTTEAAQLQCDALEQTNAEMQEHLMNAVDIMAECSVDVCTDAPAVIPWVKAVLEKHLKRVESECVSWRNELTVLKASTGSRVQIRRLEDKVEYAEFSQQLLSSMLAKINTLPQAQGVGTLMSWDVFSQSTVQKIRGMFEQDITAHAFQLAKNCLECSLRDPRDLLRERLEEGIGRSISSYITEQLTPSDSSTNPMIWATRRRQMNGLVEQAWKLVDEGFAQAGFR